MERRALELEEQEQDDQDDWFANPRNVRSRGARGAAESGPSADASGHGFRKKDAKIRIMGAWKSDDPPPSNRKPSLLDRVSNDGDDNTCHSRDQIYGSRDREIRERDRDRDRDRDKDRRRERGGWERSRDRDNDRDWDRGRDRGHYYGDGDGLSIRGSASRNDSSRHTGLEVGELREGRRWEDSRTRSSRDTERERDSRTSRDRGPRAPQYRGGYTR